MRHTSPDFSQNDTNSRSFDECAKQRNLTDKGRNEARAVGEHIKRLGIPVGTVLASPLCRTMETARLAFGKAQPMPAVRRGPPRLDHPRSYEPLKERFSKSLAERGKLVIFRPRKPVYAVTGAPYLSKGGSWG